MTRSLLENKILGSFKKIVDKYPTAYKRQNGAYNLLSQPALSQLLDDILETTIDGAYKYPTNTDKLMFFHLALTKGSVNSIVYPIFSSNILPYHKVEMIKSFSILFMNFLDIHPQSRGRILRELNQI